MCRPDTADYGLSQRDWVIERVTATDSVGVRLRAAYNLPAVAASEVAIVRDRKTCAKAAEAVAAALGRAPYPLWVIRVGAQRYFAHDGIAVNSGTPDEHLVSFLLDQNFVVLETIAFKR